MTKITVGSGEETRFLGAGLGGLGAIDPGKKPGFYVGSGGEINMAGRNPVSGSVSGVKKGAIGPGKKPGFYVGTGGETDMADRNPVSGSVSMSGLVGRQTWLIETQFLDT